MNGTPYLNPAAFATSAVVGPGRACVPDWRLQCSISRGPMFLSEDIGLMKRFTAGGERSFEFRVDMINALNRSGIGDRTRHLSPRPSECFRALGIRAGVCSCRCV